MPDLLLKKESPALSIRIQRGASLFSTVSVLLFFLMIALYGGLLFLNRAQEGVRQEIVDQIYIKAETLRPELLRQIFVLENRLKHLKTVLGAHTFPSNILVFLENQTLPQVRYRVFNFRRDTARVDLDGTAPSYAVLARQISIFEGAREIERIEFGGLSFAQGELGFKLSLIFNPAFLTARPAVGGTSPAAGGTSPQQ